MIKTNVAVVASPSSVNLRHLDVSIIASATKISIAWSMASPSTFL
jgi:hypothetical protein